jgi:hypothetical protein
MTWTFRIASQMIDEVRRDLARPHAHAAERIGFVYARTGNEGGPELQILPHKYAPVADADYIEDEEVGAKINSNAIRTAMQVSLSEQLGVFHVHMHHKKGRPRYSPVDLETYPGLIKGFQNISSKLAHGALLLSPDSLECLVWLPRSKQPSQGGRIVVVGRPMNFLGGSGGLYA